MKPIFLILLFLAQFLGGSLAAQTTPSLKDLVERFDAAQAKVDTLQAPFTLTMRRSMLKTPTVTKGILYLQGSEFAHFNFSPPEDLVLHLTPKELISYSPGSKEAEFLKIGVIKNSNRKFMGLGQKLSFLGEYFQIGLGQSKDVAGTYFLTLTPRTLGMKKRMQSLYIWVDHESNLPRQLQWVERSGDSWQLELGTIQVNQPLPQSVMSFKLPGGVSMKSEFSFFATRKK
jgi:outer membrane lipoprotein-sorting protein